MRHLSWTLLAVAFAATGCSATGNQPDDWRAKSDAILYGEFDTTRDAVVGLYMDHTPEHEYGAMCSATIVAVKGNSGYVLTAAHCLTKPSSKEPISKGKVWVLMGTDIAAPASTYPVAELSIHPYYGWQYGAANDFAMLRFTGATSSTPIIPIMTPAEDNLAKGVELDLVGYGMTEDGGNTRRRHIVRPIDQIDSMRLRYLQTGTLGGMCSGDSGGPALTRGGTESVAGVASFVDDAECKGHGWSGRVTFAYNSFIEPFLSGTTGVFTCDECWEGSIGDACYPKLEACWNSEPCMDYYNCIVNCFTGTCILRCADEHPAGAAVFNQIAECQCTTCAAMCGSEPRCNAPACGMKQSNTSCEECSNAKCCHEEQACADKAKCNTCSVSDPTESCEANSAYYAWRECLSNGCAGECGLAGEGCGLAINSDECRTCVEGECCVDANACAGDAECKACAESDEPSEPCANNPLFQSLRACAGASCKEACPRFDVDPGNTGGTGGGSGDPDGGPETPGDVGGGGCSCYAVGGGASVGWGGSLLLVGLSLALIRSHGARNTGSVQSGCRRN